MVHSFWNLIKVQALVCVVLLLLIDPMYGSFHIGRLAQSHELCQKCKEENRQLSPLFYRKNNTRHWCIYAKHYLRCAEKVSNNCRLDINFQASLTVMQKVKYDHCLDSMNITMSEVERTINRLTKKKNELGRQNATRQKKCRKPNFKPVYKVCGLFGDPHLRTFSDKRHTCSVPGAWPLFANRYLTVQVTNIPLENSSRATATSKVTVIVRGLKHKCIEEKTYQARSFSLPTTFSDGTKSSSDEKCPTTVTPLRKGRRILINICPLSTKIIIRQVGKYLTVHMRVPKDLTRRKANGLCQHGCPRIEQMNLDKTNRIDNVIASFYKQDKLSKRVKRQRQERAKRLCGAAKVKGFYYKSCLFDMLTSDDSSFVQAARKAMKDFRTINKDDKGRPIVNEIARDLSTGPIKARTTLSAIPRTTGMDQVPTSSAFTVYKSSFSLVLLMLVMLVFR